MPPNRVLFLTKYSRTGASSRYRTFQYLPALQAAGVEYEVSPLFDDAYLANKYAYGQARGADILRALVRRLRAVLTLPHGAVVAIEYELLPFFPALFERWLIWRGCRLVIDYDDALFHQYDQHPRWWVRLLLSGKIATVMRLAHTVVAGNAYLADYARRAGARRVEIIPTVVDLARYPVTTPTVDAPVFTIGWIGSPTSARFLHDISPALAEVCQGGRARLRLIGSGPIDLPGVPVQVLPWHEETEVEEISRCDVGIMPLPDEPWARGKCGLKLIQYMACGLPVVASPVGVNSEIVQDGVTGFLASTTREWVQALERLRENDDLRWFIGQAGRRKTEKEYSLQLNASKWAALLVSGKS